MAHDHARALHIGLEGGPRRGFLKVLVAQHPDAAHGLRGLAHLHRLEGFGRLGQQGGQVGVELFLQRPGLAAVRRAALELRFGELDDAVDEVAQNVGQILVDRRLKLLPGEGGIRAFRRIGDQIPAPVIAGQQFQSLIHEHAAVHRGRELAAVPVQPVERLERIDHLPRLAGAQNRGREADRMEGDIVLAHEFDVPDVIGARVQPPPALPAFGIALSSRRSWSIEQFARRGDIFDRRVEPDIEHLVLEAGTRLAVLRHRHAPFQVAGNAPVDQPFVEMLVGDGQRQRGPVVMRRDPVAQTPLDLGLQQVQMPGVAHFEISRPRHRRIRVDQVGRVQQPPAIVALIAARLVVAAMRARALDIAVGQEAAVVDGIDHLVDALLD